MCGICGIVNFQPGNQVDEDVLIRMRDSIVHRGPDDEGLFVSENVGLGHRRLSIVDVSGGHQPMPNADKTVWITYNGELYNFRELRFELESRGCLFNTKSDTEVVLRAYEVFGEDCVTRLRGMFAFGIWDNQRKRLLLARDRLGIKPLYYAVTDGQLVFASEIKAILATGAVRAQLNEGIIPEFLATRCVSGEETFFRGIKKLLPGHTLVWSQSQGLWDRRYWRLGTHAQTVRSLSFRRIADDVRDRLEAAVRSHLMSDVPLGMFLSGGLDSSGIAGLMAPMVKGAIRTFAVGCTDADHDLPYARLMAKRIGAEHHEVVLTPKDFFDEMPRLIWHEDEPLGFASSVPLSFVSRLARQHVKVVLTGEGADELFLGYERYRRTMWNERLGHAYQRAIPAGARKAIANLARQAPALVRRYAERTFLTLPPSARDLFFENFAVFATDYQQRLLREPMLRLSGGDPYAVAWEAFHEATGGTADAMSQADLRTYLVELLMRQDQVSMSASIESRVPFLDQELVEYVAAIPGATRLRHGRTKAVLRAALADTVPREILRRSKVGFQTPFGRWLSGPFAWVVDEFVLGPRALSRGFFDAAEVGKLVADYRGTGRHEARLWLLINLEMWHRIFIDGEPLDAVMARTRSLARRRGES